MAIFFSRPLTLIIISLDIQNLLSAGGSFERRLNVRQINSRSKTAASILQLLRCLIAPGRLSDLSATLPHGEQKPMPVLPVWRVARDYHERAAVAASKLLSLGNLFSARQFGVPPWW
jgi:hypothetical protein